VNVETLVSFAGCLPLGHLPLPSACHAPLEHVIRTNTVGGEKPLTWVNQIADGQFSVLLNDVRRAP
jgi:hypothetical protein